MVLDVELCHTLAEGWNLYRSEQNLIQAPKDLRRFYPPRRVGFCTHPQLVLKLKAMNEQPPIPIHILGLVMGELLDFISAKSIPVVR